MELKEITIEYRKAPVGIDENPRFSWKLESSRQDVLQEAYRIQVYKMEGHTEVKVWDSERVESEASLFIPCCEEVLEAFCRYKTVITVWDNQGEKSCGQAWFETGLRTQKNWSAEWISHDMCREGEICPVFTRQLPVTGSVRTARAYVTGLGLYELKVNGRKADDTYLAPGWTSYRKRLQYQTYDITGLLRENEENQVSITVGNGWYKGYLNGDGESCLYGDQTAVLAMVRICYEDGRTETVGTDTDWRVSESTIRSSELYHGEVQDFTVHPEKLYPAQLFDADGRAGQIVAQQCEPVRITERLCAVEKLKTPKGETVLDFGQNFAGFVEVKLPEKKEEQLTIYHAETLDKEGNFYTENLRTAKARDSYRYGAEMVGEVVKPHFTYHGFRYIKIEGADFENIRLQDYTGCVLHTDMTPTGTFVTNHKLVNRLFENIVWGQKSNFVDIPTDCPQRDERLGWTGDAQIFGSTGMQNFQTALFYKKWLRDVAAESDPVHGVPQMVPNVVGPGVGTSIWSDCATIVPWTVYRMYGDEAVLKEQYENMKLWVEYVRKSCGGGILWMNGFQRGDWLSLDGDESLHSMSGGTDKNLIANIYYACSVRILRDAAEILKRKKDADAYGELYEEIAAELNHEYVTKNGRIVTETQTACALLLYFDLIAPKHQKRVIRSLEENIKRHKGHLTTGFAGTAYLCHALSESGLHELAGAMLLSEEYPGWLYSVKKGATTIWERWDSVRPDGSFDTSGMNSLNHYSYGSIGDWLYRKIAGINALEPGYKKILIKPMLTVGIWNVTSSIETMYGKITVSYECKNGGILMDVSIPANTTAVIDLPGTAKEIYVGSGKRHYEYQTEVNLQPPKYTMNSTLEELLENPAGAAVLEKYMPGISTNPMLLHLKAKTINDLAAMAPGREQIFQEMLEGFRM